MMQLAMQENAGLAAFQAQIAHRQRLLGKSAKDATAVGALFLIKSLRAGTKQAKPTRKIIDDFWDPPGLTNQGAIHRYGVERWRPGASTPSQVFPVIRHPYKRPDGTYTMVKRFARSADEVKRTSAYRVKHRGMARAVWSIMYGKLGRQSMGTDAGGDSKRIASDNARILEMAGEVPGWIIRDSLKYATSALQNGRTEITMAAARAAKAMQGATLRKLTGDAKPGAAMLAELGMTP